MIQLTHKILKRQKRSQGKIIITISSQKTQKIWPKRKGRETRKRSMNLQSNRIRAFKQSQRNKAPPKISRSSINHLNNNKKNQRRRYKLSQR